MLGVGSIALLSLAAFASAQGAIDTLDPCGRQCVQQALDKAGSFGCSASNWPCLCGTPNFGFAIRDCAQNACPPGYAPTVTGAASAVCATATLPPSPAGVTQATTSTPVTTPTPQPSASSSQITSTSSVSSASSTTSASSAQSTSTSDAAAAAPTAASGTTSSTSAAGAASTSDAPSALSGSPGLTQTAKVGIGIGVSAVSIALLAVAACFFIRNRRSKQGPPPTSDRYKISHPMPSSGQAYTHNNNSEYDIGSGELEMKSRRYEDMLPRVQPRQMV